MIDFNADLGESGYLQNRAAMKYLKLVKCLGASTNNPRMGVNTLIRQIIQLRNSVFTPIRGLFVDAPKHLASFKYFIAARFWRYPDAFKSALK